MAIEIDKTESAVVVSVEGQMNSGNASAIEADLLAQVDKGVRRIVLDLSLLNYISSAGLRVVLLLAKKLKQQGGKLVLCRLQPKVYEVFEISGFFAILTVAESRDDALALMA